jgi:hypothetical protein
MTMHARSETAVPPIGSAPEALRRPPQPSLPPFKELPDNAAMRLLKQYDQWLRGRS